MISIIVPVYNVERYIERCVDSLINQTYRDLQIILVDDGSTDKSGVLCDQFTTIDKRIEVIHKCNGGLSSARNAGLSIARGEYIAFVDSDDWVSVDAYEYMLSILNKYNADAVQCGFIQTNKQIQVRNTPEKLQLFKGKEINQFYMDYSTKTGSYSVWKFLYKHDLLEGLYFREGKINEDIDYNYKVMDNCGTLVVSNQIKYFYYQEGNSLSTGGLKRRDFDLYEAAEELSKLTEDEEYGDVRFLGQVKKARTAFSLLSKIAYYGISDSSINEKELEKELINENRKNLPVLIKSKIPLSRKVLAVSYAFSFKLSRIMISVVRFIWRLL